MPTYDYRCAGCTQEFEVVQSFYDDPISVCEECGGKVAKVYRSPGIVFRGSGWHSKDYGK